MCLAKIHNVFPRHLGLDPLKRGLLIFSTNFYFSVMYFFESCQTGKLYIGEGRDEFQVLTAEHRIAGENEPAQPSNIRKHDTSVNHCTL